MPVHSFCPTFFDSNSNLTRHVTTHHSNSSSMRNPTRSVLLEAERFWASIPIWHPQRLQGLSVIQAAQKLKVSATPPLAIDFKQFFQLESCHAHIIKDVLDTNFSGNNAPGVLISTANCLVATNLSTAHLLASFQASDSGMLGSMPATHLCAASGVQPSSQGTLCCRPRVPPIFDDKGILPYDRLDGSMAYNPQGHITNLHQDSLYQGRSFMVIRGHKLFITAPPTYDNLSVYGAYHGQPASFVLTNVLPQLKEVSATLYPPGGIGCMDPGTLHAVLALESSATYAYDLIFSTMLHDIYRLANWEIQVAHRLIDTKDPTRLIPSIVEDHDQGTAIWHDHFQIYISQRSTHRINAQTRFWAAARATLTNPAETSTKSRLSRHQCKHSPAQ